MSQPDSRSISDDDLCSLCKHCTYKPGDMSTCGLANGNDWPGEVDEDGYVYECNDFEPPNATRVELGTQIAKQSDYIKPREFNPALTAWLNAHDFVSGDWPHVSAEVMQEAMITVGLGAELDELGWPIESDDEERVDESEETYTSEKDR